MWLRPSGRIIFSWRTQFFLRSCIGSRRIEPTKSGRCPGLGQDLSNREMEVMAPACWRFEQPRDCWKANDRSGHGQTLCQRLFAKTEGRQQGPCRSPARWSSICFPHLSRVESTTNQPLEHQAEYLFRVPSGKLIARSSFFRNSSIFLPKKRVKRWLCRAAFSFRLYIGPGCFHR